MLAVTGVPVSDPLRRSCDVDACVQIERSNKAKQRVLTDKRQTEQYLRLQQVELQYTSS